MSDLVWCRVTCVRSITNRIRAQIVNRLSDEQNNLLGSQCVKCCAVTQRLTHWFPCSIQCHGNQKLFDYSVILFSLLFWSVSSFSAFSLTWMIQSIEHQHDCGDAYGAAHTSTRTNCDVRARQNNYRWPVRWIITYLSTRYRYLLDCVSIFLLGHSVFRTAILTWRIS